MSTFYLLVGVPASGKSTWAENAYYMDDETYVVSSDGIRSELFGDERIQREPEKVFELAHKRIINALRAGYEKVVFDATNIKRKHRVALMNKIKEFECYSICVIFAEPYEVLCARNKERSRQVPEEVIWRMLTQFEMPLESEGYDEIHIINNNPINCRKYVDLMKGFDQHNSHHKLDLYEHCVCAAEYLLEAGKNWKYITAAVLHDIGKLFTQTYFNFKGEPTEEAHYYGHQNYGSYLTLMFETNWSLGERIIIAQMICYHMQPYFNKTEAARRRWREIWGDELNDMIMLLHEADEQAH